MFDTHGIICMIWWCMMLFHPSHADIQCTGSEAQESPITNVKMNWRKMELSWESSKNFSKYNCTIMDKNKDNTTYQVTISRCRFPVERYIPLHKGVFFIIEVPNTNISKNCTFIRRGMKGSAIENFSCVIYNISLMNCTWQAGRDAPGDTHYFLYWQNSIYDDAMECELYIKDENGRNTGCRFQNVKIATEKAYFLVNGSSKDALIQFYDEYIQLYKIEILTPPLNVAVNYTRDSSSCVITWQTPLTSHLRKGDCFEYEISIRNKDKPKEEENDLPVRVRNNRYEFQNYNEKKKYILKIRARGKNCDISPNWGEWSEPIEFGEGKDPFVFLFLIALGTISVILLPYFLFKRYCSFKSIFSPIPQPRDKFNASNDEDIQTEYVKLPKKSCNEEITIVEEMT
ncbi:PREDICTED: granulocyte-macrophage colony-stimulating factor receptor subunit alpha-like [Charadrius vociferus]|uniref:granulocyte-macrophage colony-stimulating factor receptor subunit alpha-like n=1 Tax=Charadrius vociferus TaxID=50402 RepID=UPI0005217649|nr:PREDICTED: granulocyte-macrophage colony-stimulating factor receptor subunit alpha-like [Charadrius vociferus]